jgi:helix-turn-helix, Psq domain
MTRPTNPALVEKEARLQEAVAAVLSGKHTGHSAAIAFDVPRQTLYDRLKGKPPRNQAHEADQLFSHAEEKELVRWITCLTIAGHPPRHKTLYELAQKIRKRRTSGINEDGM